METNILLEILLPLSLAVIMLGMGLSLTVRDFRRVAVMPRGVLAGSVCQLVLLPMMAFVIVSFFDLRPEIAVGIVLIAVCPGGSTSNLLTYLARGDAALSITLTAISSIVTIITIPLIINLALEMYMDQGQTVKLSVIQTMLQIAVITIIPVSAGMYIRARIPALAVKAEKPVKTASALFIAVVILAAVLRDHENLIPYFVQTGLPVFLLNVFMLISGFLIGLLVRLPIRQAATLSIESGIQNGTLAIAIAASATLLNDPLMAIPPAVYSLIMFVTGAACVVIFQRLIHGAGIAMHEHDD